MRHFAFHLGFLWFFIGLALLLILAFSTRIFQSPPEEKQDADLHKELGQVKQEIRDLKEAIREKKNQP
jgi:hypothetical protein